MEVVQTTEARGDVPAKPIRAQVQNPQGWQVREAQRAPTPDPLLAAVPTGGATVPRNKSVAPAAGRCGLEGQERGLIVSSGHQFGAEAEHGGGG